MTTAMEHFHNKLANEMDPSDLYEALAGKEQIIVLDVRREAAFETEQIPGSINLPHRNMTAQSTAHFNKSAIFVTYCDGIGCNASTKGAFNMARLGFNVRELIGGISWWKLDGYATDGKEQSPGLQIRCAC